MPIIHTNLTNANTLNLSIQCPNCHGQTEMQVPAEQYVNWQRGELIQNAFPNLTNDEREAMMTGICPKCWDNLFKENEEDEGPGDCGPDPATDDDDDDGPKEDAHIDQRFE